MSAAVAYPLVVVLELRERERDAAQDALAARLAELSQAEVVLAGRQREAEVADRLVERAIAALDLPAVEGQPLDVREMTRRRDEAAWLRGQAKLAHEAVDRARQGLVAADQNVQQARGELIERARELSAIETHRANWVEELRVENERREEGALQEIALSKWVRQHGEEGSR